MSERLRIVLAARTVLPFHDYVGGVEKYVHYLSRALRDLGFGVRVVACRPSTGERRAEVDGVEYAFLDPEVVWTRPFAPMASVRHFSLSFALSRYLWENPPDVLHAYGMLAYAYLHVRQRAPVVLQPFEEVYETGKLNIGRNPLIGLALRVKRRIDRYCLSHAEAVAAEGAFQADILASQFGVPRDRLFTLPVAVDLASLDRACTGARARCSALGLTAGDYILLSVNRLEPDKGIDDLLDAFQLVVREEPRARLIVVGTGSAADALRDQARREGLEGRVRWLGQVPEEDLYELYSLASVYVSPTRDTGSVMGVLEAMAAGLPVVTTGQPFWVTPGMNGYLVPQRAPREMADAILRLRPLAREFGARSRRIAEAHDYRVIAVTAAQKYQELAGQKDGLGRSAIADIGVDGSHT